MWLLKTEPTTYSYDDLEREEAGGAGTGCRNPVALRNLRAMKAGDRVLVYHTGAEKAVVGIAEVTARGLPGPEGEERHARGRGPRGRARGSRGR